jgi:hypothetical protein
MAKTDKELTSEQKLFILDKLKLGCFIRHQIDGEMYYSESAVLQLVKEFKTLKAGQAQSETESKEVDQYIDNLNLGDAYKLHIRSFYNWYLTNTNK